MVKNLKVNSRDPVDFTRESKNDIFKVERSFDPTLHPFENNREYVRALNAAKLERVFAKPFMGALDGHKDGIDSLMKHPKDLSWFVSGSGDGEIRLWNIQSRQCLSTIKSHNLSVKGLDFSHGTCQLFSVGMDQKINIYEIDEDEKHLKKMKTIGNGNILNGISCNWKDDGKFVSCGEKVNIWDVERNHPINSFKWGIDSFVHVKYNPSETNLLASLAADRSILLYDDRQSQPLRKSVMTMCSNSLSWNPMEPRKFVVANEDYNSYVFDMRNLRVPINILMGHTMAVMDVEYSPTGMEIASASYDKTIRIFENDKGRSRDIYHGKRMQRIKCLKWTNDCRYLISGSDDMNLRIWKSQASTDYSIQNYRQRNMMNYNNELKSTYGNHPQIKRILRHRHLPKQVRQAANEHSIIKQSQKRKQENVRNHMKYKKESEREKEKEKHVVKIIK
ncbi:hypothetical protein SNEBB_005002 [Seison nebaliae]|nr:hypothetical protein SNEBB_005002 [Seison nebaliae]